MSCVPAVLFPATFPVAFAASGYTDRLQCVQAEGQLTVLVVGQCCLGRGGTLFSYTFHGGRMHSGMLVVEYMLADEGPGDGGVAVVQGIVRPVSFQVFFCVLHTRAFDADVLPAQVAIRVTTQLPPVC